MRRRQNTSTAVSAGDRRVIREAFTHDPTSGSFWPPTPPGKDQPQAAHLMVNYDLPWNPNRLQRPTETLFATFAVRLTGCLANT